MWQSVVRLALATGRPRKQRAREQQQRNYPNVLPTLVQVFSPAPLISLSLDAWKTFTASLLASPSNASAPLAKTRLPRTLTLRAIAINPDARGSGCRHIRRLRPGRVGSQAPRVGRKFQQRVPLISLRRLGRAAPSPQWLCFEHRRMRAPNQATTDFWNGRTAT